MSTIQGLSIEAQDEARRRAIDEVYRRQQERLELSRELVDVLRQEQEVRRAHIDLQADLDALHTRLAEVEATWEAMQLAHEAPREAEAQQEAEDRLARTMQAGLRAADLLEDGLRMASRRLDYLPAASVEVDQRALQEKLERSAQLGTELTFLLRDPRLLTPAVLTLLAMQGNGYDLRETLSKDGLIGYFVSTDRTHQVAVRHRPAAGPSAFQQQLEEETAYQMEVETFQQEGDACLDVLEDFVLGLEATEMAGVTWAAPRHYPKRDGDSGIPVPVPVTALSSTDPREAREGPERA